jgi:hypothetical protein
MSTDSFSLVITVDSPLTAQRLEQALQEASIPSLVQPRGAASADALGPSSPGTYDVLVAEGHLAQAQALASGLLATIDQDAEANARAADSEALGGAPSDGEP